MKSLSGVMLCSLLIAISLSGCMSAQPVPVGNQLECSKLAPAEPWMLKPVPQHWTNDLLNFSSTNSPQPTSSQPPTPPSSK